jgi:hypothetical protein
MMIQMTSFLLLLTTLQLSTASPHEYMVFSYNSNESSIKIRHCAGSVDVAILAQMRECTSEATGAEYDAPLVKEVSTSGGRNRNLRTTSHDLRELQGVCDYPCSCQVNLACRFMVGYCGSSCGASCDCSRRLEDEFVFIPAAEEEETSPRDLSGRKTFLAVAETGSMGTIEEMNTLVTANCQSKLGRLAKALNEQRNYCLGNYETLQVTANILSY